MTQHVQLVNGKTLLILITTYAKIVQQVAQLAVIQVMFVIHAQLVIFTRAMIRVQTPVIQGTLEMQAMQQIPFVLNVILVA